MTDTHPVRPRLIATDLDGTLLRGDKSVSDRTRSALAAARRAGIETVFVTGRPARWLGVVAPVDSCALAICANGAAVVDLRDGYRLLDIQPLACADALRAATALRDAVPGATFAVERTGGIHYDPDYPPLFEDPAAVVAPMEELLAPGTPFDREPILKLLTHHEELDPDAFLALAREAVGERGAVTRSSPSALLEISAAGVSKATALAALCARQGFRREEVIAFGDMPNDLEMLSWAGTAYAMANAHPDVLAAAQHVTASNEADGVAVAVEKLLTESAVIS